MKPLIVLILSLLFPCLSFSQTLSGTELLDKAIKYHDPQNLWESFSGQFQVTMETTDKSDRKTEISIDLPNEYFYSKAVRNSISIEFSVDKEECNILFNGSPDFSEEIAKEHRLSCDRAKMYRNYYTYLYGLPMKLKDPGAIIHEKVEQKKFKGKEYLVLKVTYTEEVGEDIWYFYFDPQTYAMEIYQFFHDESRNDGEYILLSDEVTIQGIKMPKVRAWYMNKDNNYLGTDILKSNK